MRLSCRLPSQGGQAIQPAYSHLFPAIPATALFYAVDPTGELGLTLKSHGGVGLPGDGRARPKRRNATLETARE